MGGHHCEHSGRRNEVGILRAMAKTKYWLAEIREGYSNWLARPEAVGGLDRNLLERARGFLVYVARAYTPLWPYLKGLHLTIDGWRPDRQDGWRSSSLCEWWLERNEGMSLGNLVPPDRVTPVSRLGSDLAALEALTEMSAPRRS